MQKFTRTSAVGDRGSPPDGGGHWRLYCIRGGIDAWSNNDIYIFIDIGFVCHRTGISASHRSGGAAQYVLSISKIISNSLILTCKSVEREWEMGDGEMGNGKGNGMGWVIVVSLMQLYDASGLWNWGCTSNTRVFFMFWFKYHYARPTANTIGPFCLILLVGISG